MKLNIETSCICIDSKNFPRMRQVEGETLFRKQIPTILS